MAGSVQTYRERLPVPALAGLVSSTWVQQVSGGGPPYRHRSIPNGSVEVRCRLGSAPHVVGPLTGPRVDVLDAGSTVIGLRLHPGAAAAVLGIAASELVDLVVDATQVWGRRAVEVGERMAEAASAEDAGRVLQGLLMGAPEPDPLVAEAVRGLMPGRGDEVGSLRAALGVSERSFRRQCLAAIGVGPKALQRMLRFQGFLAQAQFALSRGLDPAGPGLAGLAVGCGYADQAHLTRECVRLTGDTPRVFLRRTAHDCGCGHDHEVSFAPLLRVGRSVQERRSPRP